MNPPYQLVVDVWEGNPEVNATILQQNGVAGMIVRLNDISGGLHMDENFPANWEKAKLFPVQAIYYVYNPWRTGIENYVWLMMNLPADYGSRRIFSDVEVRYAGYSPATYGRELNTYRANVWNDAYPESVYSGAGFLDILTPWPAVDWWAGYPNALLTCTTWEQYHAALSSMDYEAWTRYCPGGKPRMWQCSGDGVLMPGFGGHAVDVSVFPGALEELRAWFNCEEEQVMTNPIGLFTRKSGWTKVNPGFQFVAGAAQTLNTVDPNPEIKPIELEAAADKIPFLLWWDYLPWMYSEQQLGEANWPDADHDYSFQQLLGILKVRSYQAVVIGVNTYLDRAGKTEDKAFVSFGAGKFVDRVAGWLRANRPLVPLIVATSNDFISQHAPNMNNWVKSYYSLAVQPAALSGSYPAEGQKPAYFSVREECEWWRYYELTSYGQALLLFRGSNGYPPTVEGMGDWLNYTGDTTPPPDQPPDEPPANADLAQLQAKVAAMQADVDALKAWRERVKAA